MENPWKTMKCNDGKYIAPCDEACIAGLLSSGKSIAIDFNYLPQPYMGNPKQAKIFLLNGNPDAKLPNGKNEWSSHEEFNENHRECILDSLEHKIKDYPLYALNPEFKEYYIHRWWHKHLHFLWDKEEPQIYRQIVSKIFAAEYFPYFSDEIKDISGIPILESQKYTFSLVKKAIEDKKIIVIMRAEQKWYGAIEDLKNYSGKIVLKNTQNPWVSSDNMETGDFDKILKLLHLP